MDKIAKRVYKYAISRDEPNPVLDTLDWQVYDNIRVLLNFNKDISVKVVNVLTLSQVYESLLFYLQCIHNYVGSELNFKTISRLEPIAEIKQESKSSNYSICYNLRPFVLHFIEVISSLLQSGYESIVNCKKCDKDITYLREIDKRFFTLNCGCISNKFTTLHYFSEELEEHMLKYINGGNILDIIQYVSFILRSTLTIKEYQHENIAHPCYAKVYHRVIFNDFKRLDSDMFTKEHYLVISYNIPDC
jgi:hypothetical protein